MLESFGEYFSDPAKSMGNVASKSLPFSLDQVGEYKTHLDEVAPINDRVFDGIRKLGDIDTHNAQDFDNLILISNNFKHQSKLIFDFMKEKTNNICLFELAFKEGTDKLPESGKDPEIIFPKARQNSKVDITKSKRVSIIDKSDKNELKFMFDEKYRQDNISVKKSFRNVKKDDQTESQSSLGLSKGQSSLGLSSYQRKLLNFKINELTLKLMLGEVYKKFPVNEKEETRKTLPAFRDPKNEINLWAIFKENIGKDLSKITMPVYTKEPITMLQKFAEVIEYFYLLKTANSTEDSKLRIIYVSAVLYILYSNTLNRLKQPFNSLLGETYEYIQDDLKVLIEQVCNHPPILSFYCESNDFIVTGDFWLKSQLSITSFEFIAIGDFNVHLKRFKEDYIFERPATSLHNYIFGTMYFWIKGSMKCYNLSTGDQLDIVFRSKGWSSKHDFEVEGTVTGPDNVAYYTLFGKWDSYLKATNEKTKTEIEIVRKSKPGDNYDQQYFFSNFTINLNFLSLFHLHQIAPTDSRLRPDLRAYENGDFEMAAFEKNRLEENQRNRRKMVEKQGKDLKPYWFDFEIKDKSIKSKYKGGYFECRQKNEWPKDLLDLFND